MDWRDLERLPLATEDAWEARRPGGRVIRGKAAVDAAVAKWNLLDPLMVSPPGSARFLPVMHVGEYRRGAHRALLRKYAVSIGVLLAAAALLAVSGYVGDRPKAIRAGAMAFAVALFAAADCVIVRRIDALAERALFFLWIYRNGAAHALAWSGGMLVAGAVQVFAEARLGGHVPLLAAAGTVRGLVAEEPWRVLVGPLLHGSLAHWLTNLAMLAAASAIVGPLLRPAQALALFLGGSTVGALACLAVEATSPGEAYVGVSAGIFALLGWCAAAAVRRPAHFPQRFAVTAASFALLNVAAAPLASPSVSNAGHVAGLALGLLAALVFPPRCRRP